MDPIILNPSEIEWEDADAMKLPPGVRWKILNRDETTGRIDTLVHFPPGYVEPRHVHGAWHSAVLLQGRWIVEGKEMEIGGYVFGPSGVEHGPFESPEGTLVFGVMMGDPEHKY